MRVVVGDLGARGRVGRGLWLWPPIAVTLFCHALFIFINKSQNQRTQARQPANHLTFGGCSSFARVVLAPSIRERPNLRHIVCYRIAAAQYGPTNCAAYSPPRIVHPQVSRTVEELMQASYDLLESSEQEDTQIRIDGCPWLLTTHTRVASRRHGTKLFNTRTHRLNNCCSAIARPTALWND
eukprot:2410214-Rhodomonas_salina.2